MEGEAYTLRLAVIGQIEVVIDRMYDLQNKLIEQPLGAAEHPTEEANNVMIQIGALVGTISRYQGAAAYEAADAKEKGGTYEGLQLDRQSPNE